jgi:hypothetical protein
MGLIEKRLMVAQISPPLDNLLSTQLVDEFVSMERRFIQRDWEPAELDGGHFCEVLARLIYQADSGNLNRSRTLSDCLKYVDNETVAHALPRQDAKHIGQVMRTIYKFRNQRGVAHISPTYTPNQMDSKFLIESARWCMTEALRLFWQGDREEVAKAIRELLQFDVPCVGVFQDILLVQRTDLQAEEETLILLHFAGETGFSSAEVRKYSQFSQRSVDRSMETLRSPRYRQIVRLANGNYRLTDLGSRRIREELADKLLVQ